MEHNNDGPQSSYVYKGKATHRSWPQLPEEIVRLIATHYLWDIAGTNYCPQSLENRKTWYSRLVFTCVRDTQDLEKNLMPICPEWRRAIEKHPFFNQAIHVLDPNDTLIFHMTIYPKPQLNGSSNTNLPPIHLTPYQHLRNILNSSCIVCRVNCPLSNNGLAAAKKYAATSTLGLITVCREHNHRRGIFCGSCLRDEPMIPERLTREQEQLLINSPGVMENEDDDTWPHIEATCRRCRSEWLWRKACTSGFPHDREAVGGPAFQCSDWEARQNVDGFIELAEGNIADVLTVAREKWWFKMNTKYDSLAQHLLAAQRTQQRREPTPQDREIDEEEDDEEDEDDDRDVVLMRGAGQVKDLALQDWARHRILDGHWLSPADVWYNLSVSPHPLVVPTVHPCPWSREMDSVSSTTSSGNNNNMDTSGEEEESHPLKATVAGEVPPTFLLCEAAYGAHMKQFREIVGPAMRNIVRKIVMESSLLPPDVDGYPVDPALIIGKMSLDSVVRILREEEGVWFEGVDWIEKKRNEMMEEEEREREAAEAERRRHMDLDSASPSSSSASPADEHKASKEDDYDSTSSTGSSNVSGISGLGSTSSNATSPVLSTSTVQTTPSPCPLGSEETSLSSSSSTLVREPETGANRRQYSARLSRPTTLRIPIEPARMTPRLLSKVPYVPITIEHLPQYSIEAIRAAWREAMAPLYHCGCRICERTRLIEMANSVQSQSQSAAPVTAYPAPIAAYTPTSPIVVVPQPPLSQLTKSIPRPSLVPNTNVAGGDVDEGNGEVDYDRSDFEDDEDDEELDDDDVEEDFDEEGVMEGIGGDGVEGVLEFNVPGEVGDELVLYPQTHSPLPLSESETYRSQNRHPNPKPSHRFETEPDAKQHEPKRTLKRSSDELEDKWEPVSDNRCPPLPRSTLHNKSLLVKGSISPSSRQHHHHSTDCREKEDIPAAKRARLGDLERFPVVEEVNAAALPTISPTISPTSSPTTFATEVAPSTPSVVPPVDNVPARQRKRSNEELDGGRLVDEWTGPNKRARMDRDQDRETAPSPPLHSSPLPLTSKSSSPVGSHQKELPYLSPVNQSKTAPLRFSIRGMCQSDVDKLIPMDDVDE